MPATPPGATCANCVSYWPTDGTCRDNPPVVSSTEKSLWPRVLPGDWCKTWQQASPPAGAAAAILYTTDALVNAQPNAAVLRFQTGNHAAPTALWIPVLDSTGVDRTSLLTAIKNGSTVNLYAADPTQWDVFTASAVATFVTAKSAVPNIAYYSVPCTRTSASTLPLAIPTLVTVTITP